MIYILYERVGFIHYIVKGWFHTLNGRRYMPELLPIRQKILSNQSIIHLIYAYYVIKGLST